MPIYFDLAACRYIPVGISKGSRVVRFLLCKIQVNGGRRQGGCPSEPQPLDTSLIGLYCIYADIQN